MRIPVITIILLFIFTIGVDVFIYFDIKRLNRSKWWGICYAISSLLLIAFLIVTLSLPRRDGDSDISTVMWMLYSFLTIYVAKFSYVLFSIFGSAISYITRLNICSSIGRWFGLGLGIVFLAIMWIGTGYTRRHIEINRIEFQSYKLPSGFDGYKIVQLSDLHVGTWGNDTTFIANLVDSVNSLNPDLIVFTGDIVNRMTNEIEPFLSPLSRLKAKDGVYSILGNHDYGDYVNWPNPADRENNNRQLAAHQKNMNWILLNNESVVIRNQKDSIILIGVENWGEPPFPAYGDLNRAIPNKKDSSINQNDNNFKILLSHNPEHWNRVVSDSTNIDLTLSGHTHAMQTMLKLGNWKWSPSKYRYDQWGGMFERQNAEGEKTNLYVNIGAGSVGMPARLLSAYPEITEIILKTK